MSGITSSSSSSGNIKTEIVRLVNSQKEKASLLAYFTKHQEKQAEAFSDLGNFEADEDKLVYLRVFLPEQPVGGNSEETKCQIKYMYEQMKDKSETASLSTVTNDRFQYFLGYSKLSLRPVPFNGRYPKKDIDPYEWSSHAENHKTQRKQIIEYLNNYLKPNLPKDIIIKDVANKKTLLDMRKGLVLPFNIHGGTGVILVSKDCVAGKMFRLGIHATIELKKKVEEEHIYQAVLEMVVADCFVNKDVKVFGLLSDLRSVWNIFWLSENKEVMIVTLTHRKTAFDVIGKMIRSSNPRITGISDTKRTKFMDLFDRSPNNPHDDIAPMEDFYEEMDEYEVLMYKTKKAIYALKDNPIFSSMLETPPSSLSNSFNTEANSDI